MGRDVRDGPPPCVRIQKEDSAPRSADGEQSPRRRRDRRGAVWGRGGARLGNERAPPASSCATQVHRHQRSIGPPCDDDVPPGPRQGRHAGVVRPGEVRGAESGKGPPTGGVDCERGPGGDSDGAAAERGEPLDAPSSRAGRAVAFKSGAGRAVDGAGVGSYESER